MSRACRRPRRARFHLLDGTLRPGDRAVVKAGALCVGKTNLDQFRDGLVGVRSPHGRPATRSTSLHPRGVEFGFGGRSRRRASFFRARHGYGRFGRVPAAFNNIVGLKPTRGLVSARGVVPACRSLDCVSVFSRVTVADAASVLETIRGYDPEDGYSRAAPAGFGCFGSLPERFVFGVPRPAQREFFGNADAAQLYERGDQANAGDRRRARRDRLCAVSHSSRAAVSRLPGSLSGPWRSMPRSGGRRDAAPGDAPGYPRAAMPCREPMPFATGTASRNCGSRRSRCGTASICCTSCRPPVRSTGSTIFAPTRWATTSGSGATRTSRTCSIGGNCGAERISAQPLAGPA